MKSPKISFVTEKAVVDELDRLANMLGETRSSLVNEILKIALLERPCPDPVGVLLGRVEAAKRRWLKAAGLLEKSEVGQGRVE